MNYHRRGVFKRVTIILLLFFIWSFAGGMEIAYAFKNNDPSAGLKKGKTNKNLARKLNNTLDNIAKILADSTSQSDKRKSMLRRERAEIEALDREIEKQFKETETAIEKLPNIIKKRHRDFVKKYKDNFEKLIAGLDVLDKAKNSVKFNAEVGKTRKQLDKLMPSKKRRPLEDPNILPHVTTQIKEFPMEEWKPLKKKKRKPLKRLKKKTTKTNDTESSAFDDAQAFLQSSTLQDNDSYSPVQGEEVLDAQGIHVASSGSLKGLLTQDLTQEPSDMQDYDPAYDLAKAAGKARTTKPPPTEADLAETLEVQFTTEITELAEELDNNPHKIYEWVKQNITYEPYYGSLKGAQQTLGELSGNNYDQASLLIAMFRVSGVYCRYVSGTMEIEIDRLMNRLGGIEDPNTAVQIMATMGIPGKVLIKGGKIAYVQLEHVWVEAWLDYFPFRGARHRKGSEDTWIPLDPSFVKTETSESIYLTETIVFDENEYLNSGDDMAPVLTYTYMLTDYYDANYNDYDITKLFHVALNKSKEFPFLPGTLPYKVMESSPERERFSEIPESKRHMLGLELTFPDDLYDSGSFSVTKALPEISGGKLTISYTPATSADQSVINGSGGLLSTPAYLVNVKPEIKLNDTVILTGPEIPLGSSIELNTTLTSPNLGTDKLTKDITYGIAYAIGVPALDYSGDQLTGHLDTVESFEGTLHDSVNAMDDRAGELLHNISISYFRQVHMNSRLLESLMHIHNTKMPSVALFVAHAVYDELFGMPFSPPLMEGLSIDAIKVAASSVAIDGDMSRRKEFIKQRGLNSSYLEHKILENLLQIESVSAVKALQTAAKEGIPVYTIDSNNADTILPQLTLSEEDITDIKNAVNAQKEVTVSRDNVTLNDWTGVGYIVRDPETGAGAYMISHSLGGGSTTAPVSNPEFKQKQKLAYFVIGQKSNLAEYVAFIAVETYTEYIVTMSIWSDFGYIPDLTVEKTNKAELLRQANNTNTWIFYYIGHGGYFESDKDIVFIAPKPDTDDELVYPHNINNDVKIVFLNGCVLGTNSSFAASFKIDQKYNDIDREEFYLSWKDSVLAVMGAMFGYRFWLEMGRQDPSAAGYRKLSEVLYIMETYYMYNLSDLHVLGHGSLIP